MKGFSSNKIIKLLLIPSEDHFIKQIKHIAHVYIFFPNAEGMAPLFSVTSPEEKYSCGCGHGFIYTNEEEVRIFDRSTIK